MTIELDTDKRTIVQESHSDGETWGLARAGDGFFVTSGDDNKIKTWNMKTRKCVQTGTICTSERKTKRGGAASLTDMADSQCARAVSWCPTNGNVAVGHNDGTLTIRASKDNLD